jgi:hypothetical protein
MIYAEYPVWRTETIIHWRRFSYLWQILRCKVPLGIFGFLVVCWGRPDREDGQGDPPVSKPEGEIVIGWCEFMEDLISSSSRFRWRSSCRTHLPARIWPHNYSTEYNELFTICSSFSSPFPPILSDFMRVKCFNIVFRFYTIQFYCPPALFRPLLCKGLQMEPKRGLSSSPPLSLEGRFESDLVQAEENGGMTTGGGITISRSW